jgi:hypothetical protein
VSGVDDLVSVLQPQVAPELLVFGTVAAVALSRGVTTVTVLGVSSDPSVALSCRWLDSMSAAIVARGVGLVGSRVVVALVSQQPVIIGLLASPTGLGA